MFSHLQSGEEIPRHVEMKSINELTVNQSTETETSLLHAWLEIVKNSNEVAMSGFLQALYSRLEWKQ